MLINASKVKKMFGDEVLFSDVSFSIDDKEKIGFIGKNGAGKSTLFRILMGKEPITDGEIFKNKNLKIGYQAQYAVSDSDKTVLAETETAFSEVAEIEKELDLVRWEIENNQDDLDNLILRQERLQKQFEDLNGYHYRGIIRSTLLGLGFSEEDLEKPVAKLSGGQKTRVALAKILLSNCNLLLLDEPTNYLDIDSIAWLEDFLTNYQGAFVVISHDRYFLDRITNKTMSLEGERLYSMQGSYTEFMRQREIDRLTEGRNYENTMREIGRLEGIIEQQRRWNREKNIKTAESKQKIIDRLEEGLVKPREIEDSIDFSFEALSGGGKETLRLKGVSKSYNEPILIDADLSIDKGERVFLLGENGCGKTTLLKMICGIENCDKGEIIIGAGTKIGYYDQIQESLNTDKTIIEEVWDEYPMMTETRIRNALAAFLFRGEEVYKSINKLSGGERARIQLVKLMLSRVNFLVLDEPTNHLDTDSREALENALLGYSGTILAVSHDRYFINKLAGKIVNFENKKIITYAGDYGYFLEKRKNSKAEVKQEAPVSSKSDYNERKRKESENRKKETKRRRIEEQITVLEMEIDTLNEELLQTGADYEAARDLSIIIDEKTKSLEDLYAAWEEIE